MSCGKGDARTRRTGPARIALLLTTLLAAPASGNEGEKSVFRELGRHLLDSPRLLDDPGGARSRLSSLGIEFQLFTNLILGWKPRGGADTDSTFGHSASYGFFTHVDVEELAGWPGLDLLLHVKGQHDESVNPDVGALSDPVDDADFDEGIYVDELWLQQVLLDGRVRARVGFLEQQTFFDRNAYANSEDRQFMTTFLDNNAVVPLPNGLGAALLVKPVAWLELAAGVADADNVPTQAGFDTAFDGASSLTGYLELTLDVSLPLGGGPLPGRYRVGVFRDGRKKTVFGRSDATTGQPEKERGHFGVYLSFDQRVLRWSGGLDSGLGIFARFGAADGDVNEIEWFWSVGLQAEGPLPGRDRDVLGLGLYHAIGSDRFRDEVDPDFDAEIGVELYYRIALLPWLAVTPDLQYIVDPGALRSRRDAILALLRVRVTF